MITYTCNDVIVKHINQAVLISHKPTFVYRYLLWIPFDANSGIT